MGPTIQAITISWALSAAAALATGEPSIGIGAAAIGTVIALVLAAPERPDAHR